MIQKIVIKNTASFDYDGIEIDNLKKINFIYGANGCGKTTISNAICSPENETGCSIEWSSDVKDDLLVYNKKFRERNFGVNNIPGVFTLGQATKEQVDDLEQKKDQLRELTSQGQQKKVSSQNKQKEFDEIQRKFRENCWTSMKVKYESVFKEAFAGVLKSKESFANKVLSYLDSLSTTNEIIYEDLISRAAILFGESPSLIQVILQLEGANDINEIEEDNVWNKKIIGKADVAIAPLIERLGISDWVNYGKSILVSDTDTCPFCQKKTIDKKFHEELEAYFDEAFVLDSQKLKNISNRYIGLKENISNQLTSIIEKEKITSTKLDLELFEAYRNSLVQLFARNKEIIDNKIKEPSRGLSLQNSKELIDNLSSLIKQTNLEINKHNKIVANVPNAKQQLVDDIWYYIIRENKELITTFVKAKDGCTRGISKMNQDLEMLRQQYTALDKAIKEENKNVTSVQSAVDEINRMLSAYGFTNFSIVPIDDHFYQIKRENGELANNTLSEGEITFITFLYFMQLIKGGSSPETANSDRVVVIDDPISSLDSMILFVVSSLIKEEIKKIKKGDTNILQLILLTHNIYFHKEVSFIDGRTGGNKDTWYWILRKNNNKSTIQCYELANPIRGSYELLWDELKNKDNISVITLQNTMRRIYETYFRVLGKYKDDDILKKFSSIQEREICRSLLCWVNDGSHCVPDDYSVIPDKEQAEKYLEVFKQVFIVMNHKEHYNMMMGIEE